MSQVIRISDELYKRLEALASGFDTPSNVIETILDAHEDITPNLKTRNNTSRSQGIQPANNLDIVYFADSEEEFKKQLLINKKAYIKLSYTNDTSEIKEWNASRFSTTSRVDGNLRSGYLRGWKERGIYKAELAVNRNEIA
ncbi:MAG: hypothetical protein JMN24_18925 [gamma proteobacterium endosymbiont of Lamellibrachia anaximandri]|nr:hypothetical protein [gamma proteobacterium endosymbiont of Lamellibrachia anaximandri]MBL3619641.1 hypothetical protein [gamma proteobacterium endosymbiont of Lamellibrachia anaximandri]